VSEQAVAEWQSLRLTLAPAVLAELLDGGQAFRWNPLPPEKDSPPQATAWRGIFGHHAVELRGNVGGSLQWRPLTPTTEAELLRYLGESPGLAARQDALPWRSDPKLAAAMQAFPGLRILQQDLEEALIAFICSSTKRIVQIKEMVALLARNFGTPLTSDLHATPTFAQLANAGEGALRECKLGYRAKYLVQTAELLAAKHAWREELSALPYTEARHWLVRLPGVGEKVADCVLLFGGHRLEAFPVDTWIIQAMSRWYGLEGWNPRQIAQFGRAHFGEAAGLGQQYLFAAARRGVLS
jgi:N-glycosylase/DNA lyase